MILTGCPRHWSGQRGHSGHCPRLLPGWLALLLLGVPQSWGPRSGKAGKRVRGRDLRGPEWVEPPGSLEIREAGQEGNRRAAVTSL